MLDGVQILNTIPAEPVYEPSVWPYILGFCVLLTITLFASLALVTDEPILIILYSVVFGIVGGTVIGLAVWRKAKTPERPARYEVIVSDDVDFKEFYERYEIIEQKGEIYVITERKTDG